MSDSFTTITHFINSPPGQLAAGGVLASIVWKFFERVEAVLNEDTKLEIAVWLLGVKLGQKVEQWPDTFGRVFDRVFGAKHVSWKCFGRSCLATLVSSSICTTILLEQIRFDRRAMTDRLKSVVVNYNLSFWLDGNPVWRIVTSCFGTSWSSIYHGWRTGLQIALFAAIVGLCLCLFDYCSLLETRFAVSVLKRRATPFIVGLLLLLDLVLTGITGIIPGYVSNFGMTLHPIKAYDQKTKEDLHLITDQFQRERAVELRSHLKDSPATEAFEIDRWAYNRRRIFQLIAPWLPTFFTSIWLWLYAGSGFLLKAARRFDIGFNWLNRRFDIEKKPLQSIGLVAGALVAMVYWAAVVVGRAVR